MAIATVQSSRNTFLSGLSLEDFALLRNHLSSREFRIGDVLHRHGDRIDEVIFPHSGVAVTRMSPQEGPGTAIALIGHDGVAGALAAKASAPATCDCEVLSAGTASKIAASGFRYALDRSSTLRHWTAQFDNILMAQAQRTALCNAVHPVEARMCRWLLEIGERSDDEIIPLTQAKLAELLGVRRTTVTLVAGHLEAAGAVECRRGSMRIIDQQVLKRSSCECYARLKSAGMCSARSRDQRSPAATEPTPHVD